MRIKTERLILREISQKDLRKLFEHMNNIQISENLVGVPHPYPKREARWWINHAQYAMRKRPRTEYILAITPEGEDTMIGEVILRDVERDHGKANLVYWLSKKYRRQGLVSEAVKAIMDFSFTTLKLRRLEITAFAENRASNNLATKLGFKYEGTQRKGTRAESTGKVHDDNLYSILDYEYFEKYGKKASRR
jgi:ribosomal-protein-alanine N-acetyltransferase